jgi:hypothetical protein
VVPLSTEEQCLEHCQSTAGCSAIMFVSDVNYPFCALLLTGPAHANLFSIDTWEQMYGDYEVNISSLLVCNPSTYIPYEQSEWLQGAASLQTVVMLHAILLHRSEFVLLLCSGPL